MTKLDPSRFRYIPGVSKVSDIDLDEVVLHDQNGVRITEAMLDAEAEAAEAKWRDVPPPTRNLIPGGKSLSGDGKKSPKVEVILSEATHAKVKSAAKAAGMSKSRWLRKLVERELADA